MIKAISKLTVAMAVLAQGLSGCTTIQPIDNCAILENGENVCASYEEAYYSSVMADRDNRGEYIYDDLPDDVKKDLAEKGELALRHKKGFASPPYAGAPVWQPGQAFRMWAAPVKSGEVLTGGGYVYFSTEGKFNYGTLKNDGNGSGLFHPLRPEELGFYPVNELPEGAVQKPAIQSNKSIEKREKEAPSLKNIGNLY